jgi:hypothetical protein
MIANPSHSAAMDLSVAKSQSSSDRELEQAPAVLLPTIVIQCSVSGTERAGALRWRETRECPMHAMAVVVIPEGLQLLRQIDRVPEEDEVQVFAPDRADQTLNERMRHRCVVGRLDLLDLADAQVGEPAVGAIEPRSIPKPMQRRVKTSMTTSTQ